MEIEHEQFCELRTAEEGNNRYGLFATVDAEAGDELCSELPMLAYPTALNPAAVNKYCELCLSGVETPESYVRRIHGSEYYSPFLSRVTQVVLPEEIQVVYCESGCGAAYCSPNCRMVAWTEFHRRICPGTDARKMAKLEELRNVWRGLQEQVSFKFFDVGMLLRIIGSRSYEDFLRMVKMLDQGRSAAPVLAETETRKFVQQVFGPAYHLVVILIEQYCGLQEMTVVSEDNGHRLMSHKAILGIIHVILVASLEIKSSSLLSLNERYTKSCPPGLQHFQIKGDILLFQILSAELESKEETSKGFNHAGFGIFKSLLHIRRSDELKNSGVTMSSNKALLLIRALKDIRAGEEIIIGKIPQQIIAEWRASLDLEIQEQEEDSLSSDRTDIMEVEFDNSRNNFREENRRPGNKRPMRSTAIHEHSSSTETASSSSTTDVDTDEPPSRRARLNDDSFTRRHTVATIATKKGMDDAVEDIIVHDFYGEDDYGVECDVLVAYFASRLGIGPQHVIQTMFGAALSKLWRVQNLKRTVYSEDGKAIGRKHHYIGLLSKPGVPVRCRKFSST